MPAGRPNARTHAGQSQRSPGSNRKNGHVRVSCARTCTCARAWINAHAWPMDLHKHMRMRKHTHGRVWSVPPLAKVIPLKGPPPSSEGELTIEDYIMTSRSFAKAPRQMQLWLNAIAELAWAHVRSRVHLFAAPNHAFGKVSLYHLGCDMQRLTQRVEIRPPINSFQQIDPIILDIQGGRDLLCHSFRRL